MSEATEQAEIIRWFGETYPEYKRSVRVSLAGLNFGSGQRGARLTNHVRSQGVSKGEADLLIALKRGPYGSLVVEYKAGDGMYQPTQLQRDYISYHEEVGNCAVICRGVDVAKAAITQYMELPLES